MYYIYLSVCVISLQSQFVDIPSSMMVNACSRFHGDQIALAMHHLIVMMKQRPLPSSSPWTTVANAVKPDIRLIHFYICLYYFCHYSNSCLFYALFIQLVIISRKSCIT